MNKKILALALSATIVCSGLATFANSGSNVTSNEQLKVEAYKNLADAINQAVDHYIDLDEEDGALKLEVSENLGIGFKMMSMKDASIKEVETLTDEILDFVEKASNQDEALKRLFKEEEALKKSLKEQEVIIEKIQEKIKNEKLMAEERKSLEKDLEAEEVTIKGLGEDFHALEGEYKAYEDEYGNWYDDDEDDDDRDDADGDDDDSDDDDDDDDDADDDDDEDDDNDSDDNDDDE